MVKRSWSIVALGVLLTLAALPASARETGRTPAPTRLAQAGIPPCPPNAPPPPPGSGPCDPTRRPDDPLPPAGSGPAGPPLRFVDSDAAARVVQWVKDLPPVEGEDNHFSVIGSVSLISLGRNGEEYVRQFGPAAFYDNAAQVQDAKTALDHRMDQLLPNLARGGIHYLRDVQNLPWGMIEVRPGQYEFGIADHLVAGVETRGLTYVGTVMPFADWDLAPRGPARTNCQHFFREDFPYLARTGAMDRPVNLDAFLAFLEKAVERYDGDGVDDAPGLQRGIKYWQIHNEPEGPACGSYRDDVPAFVELMRRSAQAVKAACPDCLVLNGGAFEPLTRASFLPVVESTFRGW